MVIKKIFTNSESEAFKMYLAEVSQYPVLTVDEEIELIFKAQAGNKKAFDKVIQSNLRFVITVAKQFMNKRVKLSDLVNEGNIGLINALSKFDPTRGFRFITFATWDIRQLINIYLEENVEYFRIPSGKVKANTKIKSAINELTIKYNRTPTKDELIELLGDSITPNTVDIVLNMQNTSVVSFDKPFTNIEGGESNLYDVTANDELETSHLVDSNPAVVRLKRIMSILNDTERKIVTEINGLYGSEIRTMTQVGDEMGMTSSRIQQINAKALKKLKDQSKSSSFQKILN